MLMFAVPGKVGFWLVASSAAGAGVLMLRSVEFVADRVEDFLPAGYTWVSDDSAGA